MTTHTESPKVYFHTFGCQMNVYDTGKMRAQLALDGFESTEDPTEADLVLLNTCSIREKAVDKLLSTLGEHRRRKREGQRVTIGISGCVAQERGEELMARFPDVDLVFGPDGVPQVRQLVAEAMKGRRVLDTDFLDLDAYPFVQDVDPSTHGVSAFVTIQKGCDNKCTFCIVPSTRGIEVSRPHQQIVQEVRDLVDRGVQEIVLIGQNVNSYGLKVPGECTFAQLLYKVAEVPGVQRIRYTTSHPRDMGDDVVQAYRDLPQLTSHLHLPVQSGSNKMLRRMKRYYTRERFLEVVDKLRDARPDIVLTTDIIVGFADESEEDFEQTMSLLDEVGFVGSFSFKYSPRPGTPALKMKWSVPDEVAGERLTRYQTRQRELSLQWHRSLEGQTVDVLVEGPSRHDEGVVCGRTSTHAMVNFPGDLSLVGQTLPVTVTRGFTHSCRGERA
jgi:tRNA-2-methylthio-N6-dimethylallyladenosine synthase